MRSRMAAFGVVLVLFLLLGAVQAKTVITMYAGYRKTMSEAYETMQRYLDEYQRLHPDIEIVNLGREHDPSKLLALFAAGEAPDIIELGTGGLTDIFMTGALAPVPEEFRNELEKHLFPVSLDSLTYRGQLIGVPVENMTTVMYYNKEAMAEKGVTAVPKTVDELESLGRKMAEYDHDGNLTRPALIEHGEPWSIQMFGMAYLWAQGGQVVNEDGEVTLDAPPAYEMLEKWAQWYGLEGGRGFFRPGWNQVVAFSRGEIPFAFGFPWWLAQFREHYRGDYIEDFGATVLPKAEKYASFHYGHGYGVNADTKHPKEVWDLLLWLYLEKVGDITPMGHVMAVVGSLPLHKDDIMADAYAAERPMYQGFMENLPYAVNPTSYYRQFGFSSVPMGPAMLSVIRGEKSILQAVADVAKEIENKIREYRSKQ